MKKYFTLVALCLSCLSLQAQDWLVEADDYVRYQASFVTNHLTNLQKGLPDMRPKGIQAGAIVGKNLGLAEPLYLEFGGTFTWMHRAEDIELGPSDVADFKYTNLNIAIPLNLAYKYELNSNVSFIGHAGLNYKVNMLAILKSDESILPAGNKPGAPTRTAKKINLLDKDDMGGRKNRGKIFQLGAQVGLGMVVGNIYLGWQYQGDFMPLIKNDWITDGRCTNHTNYLTVGFTY